MKKFHLAITVFISFICINLNAQDAQKIFLKNLAVFEEIKKGSSVNLNSIYESREFLIDITEISYEMENTFDMPKLPPTETVEKWKSWYDENKEKLYWDKKEKKIKVKTTVASNK